MLPTNQSENNTEFDIFSLEHAFQHKVSYDFCDPPPKPMMFLGTLNYSGVTMSNI